MVDHELTKDKARELLKSLRNKYDDDGRFTDQHYEELEKIIWKPRKQIAEETKVGNPPVVPEKTSTTPLSDVYDKKVEQSRTEPAVVSPQEVVSPVDSVRTAREVVDKKPMWTRDITDVDQPNFKRTSYRPTADNPDQSKVRHVRYVTVPNELLENYRAAKTPVAKQMIGRMSEMWHRGVENLDGTLILPDENVKANIQLAMKFMDQFDDPKRTFSGLRKLDKDVYRDLDQNKYKYVPEVFGEAKGSFAKRFVMTPEMRQSLASDLNAVLGSEGFQRMEAKYVENLVSSMNYKKVKDKTTGEEVRVLVDQPDVVYHRINRYMPEILKDIMDSITQGASGDEYDEGYKTNERMRTMGKRIGIELVKKYLAANSNLTLANLTKAANSGNEEAAKEVAKRFAVAFISKFLHETYGMTLGLSPTTLKSAIDSGKLTSPVADLKHIMDQDDLTFLEPGASIPSELYKSDNICILIDDEDIPPIDKRYLTIKRWEE